MGNVQSLAEWVLPVKIQDVRLSLAESSRRKHRLSTCLDSPPDEKLTSKSPLSILSTETSIPSSDIPSPTTSLKLSSPPMLGSTSPSRSLATSPFAFPLRSPNLKPTSPPKSSSPTTTTTPMPLIVQHTPPLKLRYLSETETRSPCQDMALCAQALLVWPGFRLSVVDVDVGVHQMSIRTRWEEVYFSAAAVLP
ncbi:hypothetical protein VKT23_010030 [Stygiomarasmius scandens]|uniref:Uncharacterized protein n=1 Tax=Marasmiellus scandens TaxID=2682957 RepID=A0ABR1JDU3_9AGAR